MGEIAERAKREGGFRLSGGDASTAGGQFKAKVVKDPKTGKTRKRRSSSKKTTSEPKPTVEIKTTVPLNEQQKEFAASLPPEEREDYIRQVAQRKAQPTQAVLTRQQAVFQRTLSPEEQRSFAMQVSRRKTQPTQVILTREQAEFQRTLTPEEQRSFAMQVSQRRTQPTQKIGVDSKQELFAGQASLEAQALAVQQTQRRFGELRASTQDVFKKVPGLGGESEIQKGARTALTLPFDVAVGFPTQVVLTAGKGFVAGRALVAGQETRRRLGAELERAAPEALESFSQSFDPRTGQGVVNIIAVASAAAVPAVKTLRASKAPFTDVKAGTEVIVKTTKTGKTTYTYTNKQGGTTKVTANPKTGRVKVVETLKGKKPVTREFKTEIAREQLQFEVTEKVTDVVDTPSTRVQQFQQKAVADIQLRAGKRTLPGKVEARQTVIRTTAKKPVQTITAEKVVRGPQVGKVKVPTVREQIVSDFPKITGKKGALVIERPLDLFGRQQVRTFEVTTTKALTPTIKSPTFSLPKQISFPKFNIPKPVVTPLIPAISFPKVTPISPQRSVPGPDITPKPGVFTDQGFVPSPEDTPKPDITEDTKPIFDTGEKPFDDFQPKPDVPTISIPTETITDFQFNTFAAPFAPIPLPGVPLGGAAAAPRPSKKGKRAKKRATKSIFQSIFDVGDIGFEQTGGRIEQTGIALRK